ncbi:MAG: Na/Pi cotransporter family protein [Clostridiales bacterium]|uniref:Na/Pi cotransporter family protein n=3 Tax=Aminipila sp. TaxID=2060095 RepID=UPI001DBD6B84|nr:Na/Pi cotransporter family protein [Aminipila sp.]MBE6034040.1 Na/Pi cotransporter family protein [Clostridiales bacterium]
MEINWFQVIMTLLGGLAVFIYGMNLMSDGLQKAAGEKMRNVLALLTKNPFIGVLAGALTTAVLQSSSATTVMVIGFVSAGLMNLPQAISIVLGANIGTTITAQLIAFKVGDYVWTFILIGFIMYFFMKKESLVNIGQTIFAFGLLFMGINTMGDVMKPLAAMPEVAQMFLAVKGIPVLGVIIGTFITLIIQSSSASIAVLQNLASQAGPDGVSSIIGLEGALPILFGTNIGTTITAVFASIGSSINAKRTAAAHIIFNVTGTILFMFFIPWYSRLIKYISPTGIEYEVVSRQIANAHMFFNIINTIIFLPFIWLLVKIVMKLLPGKDTDKLPSEPLYLDYNIIEQPVFAIHLATKELSRIANFTLKMIKDAKKSFLANDTEALKNVFETEDIVNTLQDETVKYLASIFATDSLTEHQGNIVSGLIHIASDIEHIGDNCTNIAEFSSEKMKHGYEFSDIACAEIYECFDQASRMTRDTISALETGDINLAYDVLVQEEEMNRTEARLKREHIKRLHDKKCSPEFTVMYTDIVHNIERIGDSCKNIAEAVLADIHFKDSSIPNKEI